MEINYLAIATFLGGVIVQQIVNWYNKRQEYDRELKKLTYLRKLEKAEKTIAFYWTYGTNITELKIAYEALLSAINETDNTQYDLTYLTTITNQTMVIVDFLNSNFMEIHAIHLYFDLEDKDKWNDDDLRNFNKDLGQLRHTDNLINQYITNYENANREGDHEKAQAIIDEGIILLTKLAESYKRIIAFYDRNNIAIDTMINQIKAQFKIY